MDKNRAVWPQSIIDKLEQVRVIAVLVIDELDHAVPAARALVNGGVNAMELALRTPVSLDALKAITDRVPEMTAGVGTIIDTEQCANAKNAGAQFGVAPGYSPGIVDAAAEIELPFAPGIAVPSELEAAQRQGCRILKLFPAEPLGGVSYLKSINGPYDHLGLSYIPLGGVSQDNLEQWLEQPNVLAVGGSWLAKRSLVTEERWAEIERRAREAMKVVTDLGDKNK